MASHVRWGPIVRIAIIVVLVPVICLAAYVPIQQRILRWRAERLLADIRQIQMGKSTWADAQHLMHRWGEWGGYEGSCTAQHCNYQIAFEDLLRALPAYFLPSGDLLITPRKCCHWLWKPYLGLGGRFALIARNSRSKMESSGQNHSKLRLRFSRAVTLHCRMTVLLSLAGRTA